MNYYQTIRILRKGMEEILEKERDFLFKKIPYKKKTFYFLPFAVWEMHFVTLIVQYLRGLIHLRDMIIWNNVLYLCMAIILPYVFWAFSTMCSSFSFYKTKRFLLWRSTLHALLTFLQPLWSILYGGPCRWILKKVHVNEAMSAGMIINLCRFVFLIGMGTAFYLVGTAVFGVLFADGDKEFIDHFQLDHLIDLRTNRDAKYDCRILKDLSGRGETIPIYDEDLRMHMVSFGASGTGKTSSFYIPLICDFLDKKMDNMKKRDEKYRQMIIDKKAYVKQTEGKPTEYDVTAYPGYERELEDIRKRWPDCGISVLSPNQALGDEIVKLCQARDCPVNVLDPTKSYDEACVNHVGLNPFHINYSADEEADEDKIVNAASDFADIMATVNNIGSMDSGDQYFLDINNSVNKNVAIVIMARKRLRGEQVSFGDIQDAIIDFQQLLQYCSELERHYGVVIQGKALHEKKGTSKNMPMDIRIDIAAMNSAAFHNTEEKNAMEGNMPRAYQIAIKYVKDELIASESKMYDQARGLRNIINDILFSPRVYKVLNESEKIIDFDRTFERCEITVINSADEIREKSSVAIGLYFLLCNRTALKKRPENNRQPHMLFVDECAKYVNSWIEDAISFYRQYNERVFFSFQSISQLNKNKGTEYIKGTLLTAGNFLIYGRIGVEEMETFEKLGGIKKVAVTTTTSTENSILHESPSLTRSRRIEEDEKKVISGSSMRERNFQEITWIGTQNNNVREAKLCRLSFIEQRKYKDQHIIWTDYSIYQKKEAKKKTHSETVLDIKDGIRLHSKKEPLVYLDRNGIDEVIDPLDKPVDWMQFSMEEEWYQ